MRRSLRTRSRKKKTVRTPGGNLKLHYEGERPKKKKCRGCGGEIHGVSKNPRSPHSEKTVERIYGGEICAACLEKSLIAVVGSEWKL